MFISFNLQKDYEFLKIFLKSKPSYDKETIIQLVTKDKENDFFAIRGYLKKDNLDIHTLLLLKTFSCFHPTPIDPSNADLSLNGFDNIIRFVNLFKSNPSKIIDEYKFIPVQEYMHLWNKKANQRANLIDKNTNWVNCDFSISNFSSQEFINHLELIYISYNNSVSCELKKYNSSKMRKMDTKNLVTLVSIGSEICRQINFMDYELDDLNNVNKSLVYKLGKKVYNLVKQIIKVLYNTTKVKSVINYLKTIETEEILIEIK